jgi:hypothetical protein
MNGKPTPWIAAVLLTAGLCTAGCKKTEPVQNVPGAVTNANGSVTVPAQSVAPAPGQATPQQQGVLNSDGSITNPDGSVTYPAGSKVAVQENGSAPATVTPASSPTAPPPAPIVRTIPAGTSVVVRTNGTLSAHQDGVGTRWNGSLARPLVYHGETVFAAGTEVSGEVVASRGVGRFKGAGDLGIVLTSIGRERVESSEYEKARKGRGKRSAAFTGGGAGLGALIGGLAGGGKGAIIGGLAGAGGGAAAGSYSGNTDVVIPAESVITFRLTTSLTR